MCGNKHKIIRLLLVTILVLLFLYRAIEGQAEMSRYILEIGNTGSKHAILGILGDSTLSPTTLYQNALELAFMVKAEDEILTVETKDHFYHLWLELKTHQLDSIVFGYLDSSTTFHYAPTRSLILKLE